ncbi:MAG: PRC-barrel domain containing protein [Deltaproteobacteria bacterium]
MLRSLKSLINYVLKAEDGEIGRCTDFLFDDEKWVTRYIVADTGKWLPGRKVLISPISLGEPDWSSRRFPVKMTRDEVESSPPLDADAPVSRKVTGYDIEALDGEIGPAEDFIVDDTSWVFRYMVVDTRKWLPGRKVLVSPEWIDTIIWAENHVKVDLTVNEVKESPKYDPSRPVNREYEVVLYDYYGRPQYW